MGGETENDRSFETKLEAKLVEAMKRRASTGTAMKSFNTVILKLPKIDENLRKCKAIFEQFDDDSNGAIDHQELKNVANSFKFLSQRRRSAKLETPINLINSEDA
ncbi:hypothetical protein F3Y22_tig00000340pilonHSYRG00171 [Hibiscus syriacus]|uniref:EF-hand domain-containing protein n=1 Tax=Hibiscus syriacus TaxID=106335 RepID=A0A6A3D7E7_HIBSY|nr:hypothetical protein F3Y22_tig00000340pilonHSYRG00171 [Hibiscus syriacus]